MEAVDESAPAPEGLELPAGFVAKAEDDEPAPAPGPWLREEDLELGEEDLERTREQAGRNAVMRAKLRIRRERKEIVEAPSIAETPEEFMAVSSTVQRAKEAVDEGQPPWFVYRPHVGNAVLRLHEELLDFVNFMQHTEEEVKARNAWVKTITSACKALWPDCKVRIFGSFFTGLSLPNGDVDVAVTDTFCKQGTAMKMLADHMLATGDISWLEIIESAKVPVVKFRSQSCGLRADIVFGVADGMATSKFVADQLKEYPQMRALLVFLKYFFLQRGLHETYTGGMGSFLLSLVVLHFLQRHPSRFDASKYRSITLGHLLFDLFKYYGQDFRYDTMAISVVDGGRVYSKSQRWDAWKGKGKGKKGGGAPLCIESPLDPSVDLGGPCFRIGVIKNLFHHGFHCICSLLVTKSPPEVSLLCPLLLDPVHPVITARYKLMAEQPVALVGLEPAGEREEELPEEPKAKRARRDEGVPLPAMPPGGLDGTAMEASDDAGADVPVAPELVYDRPHVNDGGEPAVEEDGYADLAQDGYEGNFEDVGTGVLSF